MADSNITKRALASALRELMEEQPFEKITVTNICDKCDMNRKSFYYHFRDKYDLINWIFDTDFSLLLEQNGDNKWQLLRETCSYLYKNHNFYRKVLNISGQNSFQDLLKERMAPLIEQGFSELFTEEAGWEFQIGVLTDAFVVAFQHWLCEKEPMSDVEFLQQCRMGIKFIFSKIKEIEDKGLI